MSRLKISIAALAFVLTAGAAMATKATSNKAVIDCSSTAPNGPLDRESSRCDDAPNVNCCFQGTTVIKGNYPI